MIKLKRVKKPRELTDAKKAELTKLYKKTKKAVWQKTYIRLALLKMSNDKCCYCESNVVEESKYFEVEHYYCKDLYPSKVVEWNNLLPSCKRCNTTKGTHDVRQEPIINPSKNNPKKHLQWKDYRIKGQTKLGRKTESVLGLNDTERLVKVRFKVGEKLIEKLQDLSDKVDSSFSNGSISMQNRNRIFMTLKNLLIEATPFSEYSATAATIILNDENFINVKKLFKKYKLWNKKLQNLEILVKCCALNCVKPRHVA